MATPNAGVVVARMWFFMRCRLRAVRLCLDRDQNVPSYTYSARSATGQAVDGVLTAENYQVALRKLEEQSLFPVKVSEGVGQFSSGGMSGRIKARHLTTFYSQLSDLLRAGVPMLRTLDVLSGQKTHPALTLLVKELREDVAGGMGLGEAMGKHPRHFPDLVSSMVSAGEQGGFLEDVLARIAIFAERQDELRSKMVGAMIYPSVLVFAGGGIITFLLAFVVPRLQGHLREENYNILTKLVFGACDVLREDYLLMIGAVVVMVMTYVGFARTEGGQRLLAKGQLRAPVMGKIVTMVAVCRFCRILGTLLANGVPILQSLRISKNSAGNMILAEQIEAAEESVRKGDTLAGPLGKSGLFPADVIDMIAVAEEGNNLEKVLIQIADTNEARTGRQIDLGVRVIEPVLLVFMAAMVGVIAVALLLPIMTMGSSAY